MQRRSRLLELRFSTREEAPNPAGNGTHAISQKVGLLANVMAKSLLGEHFIAVLSVLVFKAKLERWLRHAIRIPVFMGECDPVGSERCGHAEEAEVYDEPVVDRLSECAK